MTIRARITAGPSLSAATLVDFIEPPLGIRTKNPIQLGSPDVAFDPQGFPLEGSREVTVPLDIYGTGAAVGQAMQRVARAISVPNRWLMMQRTQDTDPVWFRIRPESPGALDLSQAYPRRDGFWTWTLTLTVDSTAVGEHRVIPKHGTDDLTTQVENDGPARGFVIDAPGEAPCPLTVEVQPNLTMNERRVLVSAYSVPWDSPLINGGIPSVIIEDAAFATFANNSTRTTGNDYLADGSGITITTDTTANRAWALGPGGGVNPGQDLEPGRYLVMARLYREGGGAELEVRMAQRWGSSDAWQPWRTWRPQPTGNRSSWLPLGYLQHPYGQDGEGLDPAEIMPPVLRIDARPTVTAPSTLVHLDQVAFVPVDLARGSAEVAMFSDFPPGVGAGNGLSYRFDSEHKRVSVIDGFGKTHSTPAPLRTGGWPVAVPGMATAVSVFLDCSDTPAGVDTVAVTSDVTISAAPRLLHLGRER